MDARDVHGNLIGDWKGKNLLRLGPDVSSKFFSTTHLLVTPTARGKFLSFNYSWDHENEAQEGLLIVGLDRKRKQTTGAWVDSWHMSSNVMFCQGTLKEDGVIDLRGMYEAPPGPDWGWRICITPSPENRLLLVMYNCSPDGTEELAVQAEYIRQYQ